MTARSIRDRLRAEITDEILEIARRHLAVAGANLSLRAVARELGVVPSALYRYFPSRDALLTRLITDAYDMLGSAAEAAEAVVSREYYAGRWLALARGVREWGLANPAEYALIYGSPVPGYAAPQDTVGPASRVIMALMAILLAAEVDGKLAVSQTHPMPGALTDDLKALSAQWQGPLPDLPQERLEAVLVVGLMMWTQLFGLVNHEVFGRLNDMIASREKYFDHQVVLLVRLIGLE